MPGRPEVVGLPLKRHVPAALRFRHRGATVPPPVPPPGSVPAENAGVNGPGDSGMSRTILIPTGLIALAMLFVFRRFYVDSPNIESDHASHLQFIREGRIP